MRPRSPARRRGPAPSRGAVPAFPHHRPHIRLTNGDRIPGRLVSITGEKLLFQAELGKPQEITVPLSAVSAIWLTDTAAAWASSPAGNRVLAEKRPQDIVQLTNGDNVAGTVAGWPADGPLRIEVAGREISLPRAAPIIVPSSDLSRAAKPRSTYRQLILLDGDRLSVRTAELVADELRATAPSGAAVRIPLQAVAAINVYQGRAIFYRTSSPRPMSIRPISASIGRSRSIIVSPAATFGSAAGRTTRASDCTVGVASPIHCPQAPAGSRRSLVWMN